MRHFLKKKKVLLKIDKELLFMGSGESQIVVGVTPP